MAVRMRRLLGTAKADVRLASDVRAMESVDRFMVIAIV